MKQKTGNRNAFVNLSIETKHPLTSKEGTEQEKSPGKTLPDLHNYNGYEEFQRK